MNTWTVLLHGDAGVGKSWLGATSPAPRLILDAEGRAHYTPGKQVIWDPARERPPEAGDWESCIVNVPDFDILSTVFQWLQSGQHIFKSIVLDSLSETQKRLIDDLVGMEQLQTQDWGVVLRKLESLVRSYRDLVIANSNSVLCVVFTAGSRPDDGGRIGLLLQGALRSTLPYLLDSVGYMYVTHENGNGPTRNLLVQPTQTIIAKDGTGRLGGPVIANPNLTELFTSLQPQEEVT